MVGMAGRSGCPGGLTWSNYGGIQNAETKLMDRGQAHGMGGRKDGKAMQIVWTIDGHLMENDGTCS